MHVLYEALQSRSAYHLVHLRAPLHIPPIHYMYAICLQCTGHGMPIWHAYIAPCVMTSALLVAVWQASRPYSIRVRVKVRARARVRIRVRVDTGGQSIKVVSISLILILEHKGLVEAQNLHQISMAGPIRQAYIKSVWHVLAWSKSSSTPPHTLCHAMHCTAYS